MDKKTELPDLKKKERERKKAGLFWGDGAGARAAFEGATGALGEGGAALEGAAAEGLAEGSVAAMDAAESAAGRGLLARLAAFAGRLAGTFAGKLILLGVAALVAAGGLYAAARYLQARAGAAGGRGDPSLSAPDLMTRIFEPRRSRSLDYLNQAYKGELKGDDDGSAGKDAKGDGKDGKDAQAGDGAGDADKDKGAGDWKQAIMDGSWRKDRLAHNMSDAHLSDSLGGGFSKNVFAAADAPKFGDGFDRGRLAQAVPPANGRASSIRKSAAPKGKSGSSSHVRAKRAIGQLRAANSLSTKAAQVGNEETAKTMATDAFNGAAGSNGAGGAAAPASPISMDGPSNIAGTPGGTVNPTIPSGGGTPDPNTYTPPDATPTPQQDYQPKVDTASNLIDQAAQMKKRSMMLMVIGLGLIAAGAAMLPMPAGIAMIAAGAMLVGMAIMLAMMASKMAAQAKQIGQELQQVFGQQAQNQVIDTCAQQAASSGQKCAQSTTDAMAPASLPQNNQMGDAGKAAAEENYGKDSQYTVDGQNGGGPVGPGH